MKMRFWDFAPLATIVTVSIAACSSTESPGATPATDAATAPRDGTTPPDETADGGADSATSNVDSGPAGPPVPTTGTGTYESNVGDFSLVVKDVYASYRPAKVAGAGYASELNIKFFDHSGACADRGTRTKRMGSKEAEFEIEAIGATAAAAELKPGTFPIEKTGDGQSGLVYYGRSTRDTMCSSDGVVFPITLATATVKKVVITTLTATHVAGSYEITGNDGKYIKGVFDADICTVAQGSGANICK